jgi:hypothetical protein
MTDAVTSTMFHPMGSVAATCSGQRHFVSDDPPHEEFSTKNTKQADNSLKVWSMPFLLSETETNHDLDSSS